MSGFFNSRKKQAGNSEDSGAGLRPEDIAAPDFNESTPDLNDSAARFLDETYHLTDQPIADSPPDVRPEKRLRQRRKKQPVPRRFGVPLADDGKNPLPLKRAAVPIEDILARRGREGGYTAGPGGPAVYINPDPYGHGAATTGTGSTLEFENTDTLLADASGIDADNNVTANAEPSLAQLREAAPANDPNVPTPAIAESDDSFDFLDNLDRTQQYEQTNDLFDVSRIGSPAAGSEGSARLSLPTPEAEFAASRRRRRLAGFGVLLLGAGVMMTALAYLGGPSAIVQKLTGAEADADKSIADNPAIGGDAGDTLQADTSVFVQVDPEAGLSLRRQRDEALGRIGSLIESGDLQEAQIQLDDLDLVVYGYGQQEFDLLLERIEEILQGNVEQTTDDTLAEVDSEVDKQTVQAGDQGQSNQAAVPGDTATESQLQTDTESQTFSAETARLREEARAIALETRLAREQAAEEREQQQAELARVLSQQREAEQERIAQIEQQRELAQAARVEEELRLQQVREQLQLEQESAEAALREIEQRRIAEETRLAEAAAELEQQRLAQRQAREEATAAEQARQLAEQQRQQEAELLARQQAEEQEKLEAERQAAEQLRLAEEQAEAARRADLQRQQEAQLLARQQAVEQQRLEQERQAAEQALAEEQARLAELQRQDAELLAQQRAEQQERLRQERLAAEQAEAERLAELQRQQEQQRLAEAEEQERLAEAEEQERIRLERQAIELARSEEAAQQAELERQRQEQLQLQRQAEFERQQEAQAAEALEQRRKVELAARLAAQRRQEEADRRVAEASRLADERRAEQRAAEEEQARQEREAARRQSEQQAIAEQQSEQARQERQAAIARQREILRANAAERQRRADELDTQDSDAELVAVEPEPVRNRPISDVDIARVYRQFQALEQAIEARDMDRVLGITEQSGSQVGLFLQLFQNFDELDVRIENVSSQPATGVIQGKLRLRSVVRNGVRSAPPAVYPGTTSISSRRTPNGQWSKIVW